MVEIVKGGVLFTMLSACEALVTFRESFAVTEKLDVPPGQPADPVIAPVEVSNVSPEGKAPVRCHV